MSWRHEVECRDDYLTTDAVIRLCDIDLFGYGALVGKPRWLPRGSVPDSLIASPDWPEKLVSASHTDPLPPRGVVYFATFQHEAVFARLAGGQCYIVVSGQDDVAITSRQVRSAPLAVKRWVGQNVNIDVPLVEPIMFGLGLNNWYGHAQSVCEVKRSTPRSNKNRLFACFASQSRLGDYYDREYLLQTLPGKSWATVLPGGGPGRERTDIRKYREEIRAHDFVASPRGAGVDCLRTWEAICLGSIPVVKRSPEMRRFYDLPVAFLDSWEELTEDWLDHVVEAQGLEQKSVERLFVDYWEAHFAGLRELLDGD